MIFITHSGPYWTPQVHVYTRFKAVDCFYEYEQLFSVILSKVKELESGDNTDEECWYPKNMEELVTVDEVGGEDDSIIEPDLPELDEYISCPKESAEEEAAAEHIPTPTSSLEVQGTSNEKSNQEKSCEDVGDKAEAPVNEKPGDVLTATSPENQTLSPVVPELPVTNLSEFPNEEFKAALEETCSEDKAMKSGPSEEPMENHIHVSEDSKSLEVAQVTETINDGVQHKDAVLKKGTLKKNKKTKQVRCL